MDEWTKQTIIDAFGLKNLYSGAHKNQNAKASDQESFYVYYIWIIEVRGLFGVIFTLAGMHWEFENSPSITQSILLMPSLLQLKKLEIYPAELLQLVEITEPDPIAEALRCVPLINQARFVDERHSPRFQVMTFNGAGDNFFQFNSLIGNNSVLNLWNVIWETARKLVDAIDDKDMKDIYWEHHNNYLRPGV